MSKRVFGAEKMKTLNTTKVLICLLWLGSVGGVGAQPDQIDNKTAFTVSEPMEVPGAVLHPGTYIIRSLKKPSTQRTGLPPFNILQLLSADEKQLYATIVSIPEYYPPPSDQPIFTFYERSSNFPRAIKAWWPAPNPYPYAEQFAYPRTQALEVESAAKMHVLSLPSDVPANTTKRQDVIAKTRSTDKKAFQEGTPMAMASAPWRQPSTQHATSAALPKTASLLPLLAVLGLLAFFGALVIEASSLWVARLGRYCTVNLTGPEIASSVGPPHYFAGVKAASLLFAGGPLRLRILYRPN